MFKNRAALGGYVALIVLVSAGAAQGLSGANTVFSDDIVDGQVSYVDIRDGAVGSKKIFDNSVTGVDVSEATLRFGARRIHTEQVLDASTASSILRSCPAGARLMSAAAHWGGDNGAIGYSSHSPQIDLRPDLITAKVNFATGSTQQLLSVDLICAAFF